MSTLLQAISPQLKYTGGVTLQNPHTLTLHSARAYAVIGPNGSGKTTLANIIERGWNFTTNVIRGDKSKLQIRKVEFTDIHSLTGFTGAYYQQRFESTMNDDIPTVAQLIAGKMPDELWRRLCKALHVDDILNKRINYLSSGELRKFLIINILTERPDILIIDNPYIGLDADSRSLLDTMLQHISEAGTTVVMLLCNSDELPPFVHYMVPMSRLSIGATVDVRATGIEEARRQARALFAHKPSLRQLPAWHTCGDTGFATAFALHSCNVMYGQHIILHNVSWTVAKGEKWALLGENGAGKSTLLSLVCCDNPQGYCNTITLFDRPRGTGESIWDVKRRISALSPEMHLYFSGGNRTVTEIVAGGLHDMKGLYVRPTAAQAAQAVQWLEALGIDALKDRSWRTLCGGEQRLALLARTLIRQAPLLILDEPLHGLDEANKRFVRSVIERIASRPETTLIYVTHYRNEIPSCVSQVFTLAKHR